MPTVDYETGVRFERRIGKRVTPEALEVAWVDRPVEPGHRGDPDREWPGRVENVSVTGAAVLGPTTMSLAVGDHAILRYDGGESVVLVCRDEPTEERGVRVYGVEFKALNTRLRSEVYALVSEGRSDEVHWYLTR